MKATVYVRLKAEVLDPQGEAVKRGLAHLGIEGITQVRVGKLIEIDIAAPDAEKGRKMLEKAADELLANPVIEDYEVVVR